MPSAYSVFALAAAAEGLLAHTLKNGGREAGAGVRGGEGAQWKGSTIAVKRRQRRIGRYTRGEGSGNKGITIFIRGLAGKED